MINKCEKNFVSLFSTYGTSPLPFEDCLDSSRSDLLKVNIDKNFNIVGRSGLIDDLEITSLFNRELFPNGYKKNFDDLPIKFRAVSYNVNKRTRTVHSSGHLMEAMRASMGIPLVFQMYNINNEEHLDGGLVDNIPISVAKELGGNIIITSDVFDLYCDDEMKFRDNFPDMNFLSVEMEAFGLFYVANKLGREASCLMTVVDSLYDKRSLTSEDRETSLNDMIEMALESII